MRSIYKEKTLIKSEKNITKNIDFIKLEYSHGLTGNFYIWTKYDFVLEALCVGIGKSIKSIYYSKKYNVYAIRIKRKSMIEKAKNILLNYEK